MVQTDLSVFKMKKYTFKGNNFAIFFYAPFQLGWGWAGSKKLLRTVGLHSPGKQLRGREIVPFL